jgi:hypothetical protein
MRRAKSARWSSPTDNSPIRRVRLPEGPTVAAASAARVWSAARRAERAKLLPATECDQLGDSERIRAVDRGELRQMGQSMPRRALDAAARRTDDARDCRQQSALAGLVRSDNGGEASRRELAADRLHGGASPISHREVVQRDPTARLCPSEQKRCPQSSP